MGTLGSLSPTPTTFISANSFLLPSLNTPQIKFQNPAKKSPQILNYSSKFGNFLDLKPVSSPGTLDIDDLSWVELSDRSRFDAIVIGSGPSGLRLASLISSYGIKVCVVDPSPLSMWSNNYGGWVDEFEAVGLEDCLDKTWGLASVCLNANKTKYLDRPYGRVNRKLLKEKLLEQCVTNGVKFLTAKVWEINHKEFESCIVCNDGNKIIGSLIIDTSGFGSSFVEYDKPRNHGFQIAHGILAEVESHPFDLDKMVLMDWTDDHLGNEPYLRANNSRYPTFLYAMPFTSNLIFLEETSLVSRPAVPYNEVKMRMAARLRHLGIRVKTIIEDEKCLIPMGGPLPKNPQSVTAFGGCSGIVHPSTGYMVARSLALAPIVAEAIAECLGSTRMIRGKAVRDKVWKTLWSVERRSVRECYSFGMETLLKLDLDGTRSFFDAFFDLDPYYWHGFLSSRLSVSELGMLSLNLFGNASNRSKFDIVTKCPVPLVKMMANLALNVL
ncbi:capsanthin/capsorubin synthase, chromoplastic-like [Impatiens glandulifera]|uniref:capsanthin/capsorubin synthase, chromoplastic-like n=1 Tax=Impatiens glandulifera TaxID=253017 RepID=UPI001FB0CD15|nr:capsanthin/capsorubin synthase, chromoplastic-like [Impatiens glandulifera]